MERKFKVIVEKGLDGYYIAEVPELPGCYTQAKTIKELMENIKEAIELYLEDEIDLGKKPEIKFIGVKEVVVDA